MRIPTTIALLAATTAGASAADLAAGQYECWFFNQPQEMLNFTIAGAGQYLGHDGSPGIYQVDGDGVVTFLSGPLQGAMPEGFTARYEVRQGRPTLSYISGRGSEAAFCEHV